MRSTALRLAGWMAGLTLFNISVSAEPVEVAPPAGTLLSVYDEGFATVQEMRRVLLQPGDNEWLVTGLPATLDPSTLSLDPAARGAGFELYSHRFTHPLTSFEQLLSSRIGETLVLERPGTRVEGVLSRVWLDAPEDRAVPWVLLQAENRPVLTGLSERDQVTFPGVLVRDLQPSLVCRVQAIDEGPATFRLGYRVDDLSWNAYYDVVLGDDKSSADFRAAVELMNHTGGNFADARVRLVVTEKGAAGSIVDTGMRDPSAPPLRYPYGVHRPAFEKNIAGYQPAAVYELPRNVSLADGETMFVDMVSLRGMPVEHFYVYDGVKFDRFRRDRRNDWSYGTESHTTVETHLAFRNDESAGLGMDLPPGRIRLYQPRPDGNVDFVGEAHMPAVASGEEGSIRLGPARGLIGERERTGYVEVTPLHEYEESFEIRLENSSEDEVEVRVVEHMYRWDDYEIVKADTEYEVTGPRTIEFRPVLKPDGRRSIHYTVRYRW